MTLVMLRQICDLIDFNLPSRDNRSKYIHAFLSCATLFQDPSKVHPMGYRPASLSPEITRVPAKPLSFPPVITHPDDIFYSCSSFELLTVYMLQCAHNHCVFHFPFCDIQFLFKNRFLLICFVFALPKFFHITFLFFSLRESPFLRVTVRLT